MPDADPTRPAAPDASPPATCRICGAASPASEVCEACMAGREGLVPDPAAARTEALRAVAELMQNVAVALVGATWAEALHGRYGLAAAVLGAAAVAWYAGVLIDDRRRGGAR